MQNKLFYIIKNIVDIKLLKFIIVGVLNTCLGLAITLGLYNVFGLSYWVSSSISYFLASVLSYNLNKHFTFQNKSKSWRTIIRFVINIAVCYGLAYGIAKPMVFFILSGQTIKRQENIAMIVGNILFTGFNYIGQRFFAFKTMNENRDEIRAKENV